MRAVSRALLLSSRLSSIPHGRISSNSRTFINPPPKHRSYASMSASPGPRETRIAYSSNTDRAASAPRVDALLHKDHGDTKEGGDGAHSWSLTADARGLWRQFRFKTFKTTWAFMNVVADKCAEERHHPEWTNIYNKVTITWTTHRPQGLSYKDLTMAEFCDDQARAHGEVDPPPSAA